MSTGLYRCFSVGGTDRTVEADKYLKLKQFLISRGAPKAELDHCLGKAEVQAFAISHGYLTRREVQAPESAVVDDGRQQVAVVMLDDLQRIHDQLHHASSNTTPAAVSASAALSTTPAAVNTTSAALSTTPDAVNTTPAALSTTSPAVNTTPAAAEGESVACETDVHSNDDKPATAGSVGASLEYLATKAGVNIQYYKQVERSYRKVLEAGIQINMPDTPQRVRFVHVSDTHSKHRHMHLPAGDVLIHTGDILNNPKSAPMDQLEDFCTWIEESAPRYSLVVLLAGNHDMLLDPELRIWGYNQAAVARMQSLPKCRHCFLYCLIESYASTLHTNSTLSLPRGANTHCL